MQNDTASAKRIEQERLLADEQRAKAKRLERVSKVLGKQWRWAVNDPIAWVLHRRKKGFWWSPFDGGFWDHPTFWVDGARRTILIEPYWIPNGDALKQLDGVMTELGLDYRIDVRCALHNPGACIPILIFARSAQPEARAND